MIANVSAHRRANAFAQALEEQSDQDPAAEQTDESVTPDPVLSEQAAPDRMLTLATGLGELPKPELDPEVKVVQRAQLVAAMEAMLLEGTAAGGGTTGTSVPEQRSRKGAHRATGLRKLRPRSRLSKGIAAGGLTVGVAAGAFSGVAAASSDALPGDSLYGLKRGMEDIKLGMADDDGDKGEIYLDHASTRLNEARRLMERGRAGDLDHESLGEIRRALSGMQHDAAEGHRLLHEAYERDGSLGPIQALSAFSESHRSSWSDLHSRLPVQLGDVGEKVNSVFDAMDQEVDPLRSLLPRTPETSDTPDRPSQRSSGSSTPDRPSAPESSPGGGSSDDSKPHPSNSDGSGEDDGLLGGNTGGLLDPPKTDTTPTPSDDKPENESPPAKPGVTVPPLLPGLLPGLGIEGEDTK
ncbi:DUF5667 domain-containing protein [Streptomyces sp. NBC_01381]|uniref:DUF5667 domain-containing protein n=1 Tax=Streptomyces sp. NBC_01381 TaxID=2903845 RepID=UPI00225645DC|nr:DUF5667 domain-containing protein [Streptomyces sp. NBC_01381]MCX4665333.1 DUF5667 domain-containing protein [Streptomyces sp. NBC_01381]